jgi:hypothetical protein
VRQRPRRRPSRRPRKQNRHSKAAMLSWRGSRAGQAVSAAARGVADDDARADRSVRARWPRLCNPSPTTARKVRQLALCWRVIAFIAHRIGDRTDPDVPAEARRAVDTGSAGPLGHSFDIGPPRQHCLPLHELTRPRCSVCTALLPGVRACQAGRLLGRTKIAASRCRRTTGCRRPGVVQPARIRPPAAHAAPTRVGGRVRR